MLLKLPFDLKMFLLNFLTHRDIMTIKYILGRKLIYLSLKMFFYFLCKQKNIILLHFISISISCMYLYTNCGQIEGVAICPIYIQWNLVCC